MPTTNPVRALCIAALLCAGLLSAAGTAGLARMHAQSPALATVAIPVPTWAAAKRLPAGTYDVRRAGDDPVVEGEPLGGQHWIEFTQNGAAHGREVAMIVTPSQAARIARGPRPDPDRAKVDVLDGNYVRIWINAGAMDYLISLPLAPER